MMKEGQPNAIFLKDYEVPPFLVDTTELRVEIGDGETRVTSVLKVRRNPEAKADGELTLDGGPGLATESVLVDGVELQSNEYRIADDELTVFDVPEAFTLTTTVRIEPEKNTALEGLYKSGGMYCTQCEAEGFRNITWFPDRPDVMSTYRTTVVAAKDACPVLLSNGNLVDSGEAGDGRHFATWHDPFPKPSYLFALVAGELEHIEDSFTTMSGREVKLQIFTEAHNIDKVDFAMASLKNSMAWDERAYGREYDLDIFMVVAVESFNMGAMENKGLNIFNTSCVLARPDTTTDAGYQRVEAVVGHEYFHNWSGNRVTCRDWFQLSLKEGFTVLRDQQFSAEMGSPTVCRIADVEVLRRLQFPEDASPMAHSIRPDSYIEINNFYTATVYEKGAEVVRMIRTLLGPEGFRKGTDLYFDRHDGQAVTTEDFVTSMEDATGADLGQFRNWYRQAGTPVLTVTDSYDEETGDYTLTLSQHCPPTPGQESKDPYHMPVAIGLVAADGKDLVPDVTGMDVAHVHNDDAGCTVVLNLREATQTFVFKGLPEAPVPSLLRGFSAPVRLRYDYSRDALMFLMSHDSDGFNRWEAGQQLAVAILEEMVGQQQSGQEMALDGRLVRAIEKNLNDALTAPDSVDGAMIAQTLTLPAASYLIDLADEADVDAIVTAREFACQEIGKALKGLLLTVYKQNQETGDFSATQDAVAKRALKNQALGYLVWSGDEAMLSLAQAQYDSANCMTDTSRAIQALMGSSAESARSLAAKDLVTFYNRWADEALVIDHWFAIQSMCDLPGALSRVESLMAHEAFTLTNPNRMRSVVMAFTENLRHFHAVDGSGYDFLADRVIELNGINPQMAARVLRPLTRWRKFGGERRERMRSALERILEVNDLSPDVFEIASKSVAD